MQANKLIDQQHSVLNQIRSSTMATEGQEAASPTGEAADTTTSPNKHLTRLVRFSILQAKRSSSKAAQGNKTTSASAPPPPPPPPIDTRAKETVSREQCASPPVSTIIDSINNSNNNRKSSVSPTKRSAHSPLAEPAKFPFAFSADKERPTTEVAYKGYNTHRQSKNANNNNHSSNDAPPGHVGVIPGDPPIMEDLSQSFTQGSMYNSASYSEATNPEDMHLLLAPDSGHGGAPDPVFSASMEDSSHYNSAEMYSRSESTGGSSSSSYVGGSHSSDSSDSIMRRVEAEIANARKASSDAQARLAYFTQRQKDLTPVSRGTDSYSFDFDSLVDVGDLEDTRKQHPSSVASAALGNAASPRSKQRGMDPPVEDNFENAMGVIGQEFDATSNDDVDIEEKVDIEVVLAPSEGASPRSESSKQKSSPRHPQQRSPKHHRKATGSPAASRQKSPRHATGDSVDIVEAVISAAFSEKSIESLPVKESLPAVFSEQSMDSLPTQASSVGADKNNKPVSLSFQDMGRPSDSPARRRPNKLPAIATQGLAMNSPRSNSSPMKSPSKLTIDTEAQGVASPRAASVVSPTHTVGSATSFSSRRSKLPSTPREPGTPSYRERLENKLKILGSRYPASPVRAASASPKRGTPKTASDSPENMENAPSLPTSPIKTTPKGLPPPPPPPPDIPRTPKQQNIASPSASQVASPLGEAYDGLENRIKDLLARTLNPYPEDLRELSDKDCPTSPSAELKAIKKLLEQGVAAAEAAEETKAVEETKPGEKENVSELVAETTATMESLNLHGEGKEIDLDFPDLNETLLQEVKSIKEEAYELQVAAKKATAGFRLHPRTSTPVATENVGDEKYAEPPALAFSTSEEILEQLDSFSNSNEFKSKARKPVKAKAAPAEVTKQENGGEKAGKKSPSKMTKRELGEKATSRSSPTKSANKGNGKKQGTVSTIKQIVGQIIPDSTPEMQTVQNEPVPSDEIYQDDSLVSPTSYKAPGMWESCEADPEVEEEVEINIADALSPPNPGETTTSPKKTPSALNLALTRPCLSPPSEQNMSEKSTAATFSEKDGGRVPEAASKGECINDRDKVPAAKAPPVDEGVDQTGIDNVGQALTEKNNSASTLDDDPTKTSAAVEATSMIASLIATPGSNLHPEAAPDDEKEENKKPPPNVRVKSVTVVSPKSADREDNENTPPPVSKESPKPRTSSRQDRKIRFRDPYPTPTPNRKTRTTEEIQLDHSCKPTLKDGIVKWKDPKGDLKRLLVAALDSSVSRRSNACGALKVISKLEKNKVVLVRTKGFLDALVFVATDEVADETDEAKQDARARAISCIYNVSHVKGNRLAVCMHPGLLECLVKTLSEDRGEARMEACGTLAQLAKNPMCRERMVEVDELLSTLASVLKGTIDPEEKMMDMLSQDFTEEAPSSSYSEMSSVLSEEHLPFPKKSPRSPKHNNQVRSNFSIRKQKSEMYDQYFNLARLSACAALVHLSKQCSVVVSYNNCGISKCLAVL